MKLAAFITAEVDSNYVDKEDLGGFKESHIDRTKSKRNVTVESDNRIEAGMIGDKGLCRGVRDFEGAYRASREVVLQSLLSRAGVRNLGSGPHLV